MAVVLHLDMGVFLLDIGHQLSQQIGTADTRHILEANFVGSIFYHLVHDVHVVGHGMDGGVGDGQGHLGNHSALLGANHGALEVAVVVEAAERTGNVRALLLLYLEHEFAHIQGYGVHAEGVEAALQHVRLDARLVEGRRPGPHGLVGILSEQEVHLLEGAAVGFHPVEAAHVDNGRSHLHQLVHPGHILARALPHVPIHQGELDFTLCHISVSLFRIRKDSNFYPL